MQRLRLTSAYLEDMLASGAFSRVYLPKAPDTVEGRLVWSPLDKDFVLVWQDRDNGAILTCMLLCGTRFESKYLEIRGEDALIRAKVAAKTKASLWLLASARPEAPPATQPEPEVELAEAPPPPPSPWPWHPDVRCAPLVELHFPHGRREALPLDLLPQEFLLENPLDSQRAALRFAQALLNREWGPPLLAGFIAQRGRPLDDLLSLSVQRKRANFTQYPRVMVTSTMLDCAMRDLEEAKEHNQPACWDLEASEFCRGQAFHLHGPSA